MGCNCLPLPSCKLQVTNGFSTGQPMASSPLWKQQRKKWLGGSQRVSKVVAYYGSKAPPYELGALEPYVSKKTLEVHWGEHHRGCIEGLNKALAKDDVLYGYTMDELVKVTYNFGNPLPEFNNAAQVWNHNSGSPCNQEVGKCPKLVCLSRLKRISVPTEISERSL